MKRFFLAGIVVAILCQLGCSPDEEQTQLENPTGSDLIQGFNAPPFAGDVVLENMYEDEAGKLTSKTPLEMITVLEGTSKVVLQARFRAVQDGPLGFPVYECELIDESAEALGGIALGMSGSPVGPPGRVMGAVALASVYSKPPYRFWVMPIDYMEAAIDHPTFGEFLEQDVVPVAPAVVINTTYVPIKTPLMITGIQADRLQEISSHLPSSKFNFVKFFADIGGASAAPPAGATTKLSAGDMIGVAIATGDVVNAIGFGTVTQVYDNKFVAFGHPMLADGKSALPIYRAVTHGIDASLEISNKSVSAYGNPIGTMTKDLYPAIVGALGPGPAMIPVKVSYHPVNSPAIEKHHVVAYGQEWIIPSVAAGTMDAIRLERFTSATVEAVVTLRFQETESVYTEAFRSASPVPFLDVLINTDFIIHSFTDTLRNSAGKATLKEVLVSITDKPQIAKAEIDEVIVQDEAMPGESLTVSVVLVPHWSTAGAERTIQRDIMLDIPEDFPAGKADLTVSASAGDFPGLPGFPGEIGVFQFGEPDEEDERPLPKNLDELIQQKEEDLVDAGLITIMLTASGFGSPFPDGLPFPERFPLSEEGEVPEVDEVPEEDKVPEADEMPEGFPLPDDFAFPEAAEPPPPVKIEIVIDGFIVTGFKEATVTIKVEDMAEGMMPVEGIADVEEE